MVPDIRTALFSVWDAVKVLFLLSIPLVLAVIYYLTPRGFQTGLALDHTAPRWYAFWTSSLVHEHRPGDGHLLGNVGVYVILVIPCWLLYWARSLERRF